MQTLIEKAKQDLAQRLSVSVDQINPVEATEVVWPDASLGCPQQGVLYTQVIKVITPGYQILLEANRQVYTFQTDETEHVILCEARAPDEIFLSP